MSLKKTINEEQIRFYLKSCKRYRFPFFDPTNCYRQDGLFGQLEEVLNQAGEKMSQEYGENFVSINLRGSWLRGIPIEGDDIDVLYIVKGLPKKEKLGIQRHTRQEMRDANDIFQMCEGKTVRGIKVEPIIFLDLLELGTILNEYMYGLNHFLKMPFLHERDFYQDSYFGSKVAEKKSRFLKSGILIPYVGWIYGKSRKAEVFRLIGKHLPIPTKKTAVYNEEEIKETKETIRQAFISRNLVYPSLEITKFLNLTVSDIECLKDEALQLYPALKPLEEIHARAVINYIYTLKIEEKFLGRVLTRERIEKFASSYDDLVCDITSSQHHP